MVVNRSFRTPQPTTSTFRPFLLLAMSIWAAAVCAGLAPVAVAGGPDERAKPVWASSTAGVSDAVLPPWTPVKVAKNEISVWGRTYGFRGLPFPTSVITRGTEILAAPIRLLARVDEKQVVWSGLGCRNLEAKPNVVRLAVRADSDSLRCTGVVSTEYDGMIRSDLKLAPKQENTSLDALILEIPIHPQYAKYLHVWPGKWGSVYNSSSLPEGGHQGPFKPFVWLGDEWRGFAWFSESDRNFFNNDEDRVVEIQREGEAVVLRVNLITEPQAIENAIEYTFGFQATPVKPMKPDVWDYRIWHMGAYGVEDRPYNQPAPGAAAAKGSKKVTVLDRLSQIGVRTMCFHEQWTDIQAYPKTTHGEQLHKLVAACHERNIQLLLYHGYLMSTIAPEWEEYHERCLVHPRRGAYKRIYQPEPEQTAYMVCFRSVWQNFIAHHLEKLVEEYGIDGVYLDGTSEPWGCRNVRHGCGYTRPDGEVRPTYPIFDTRAMMKRIYTIVKAHNPDGQVNVHQSTCMTIPTLAFATSYWDGEQLQNVARKPDAQEVLPLDAFRCEFMGHNWGVPAELLHYASGPSKRTESVGLALLHDVLVRPSSMDDGDLSVKIWNVMDAFGRKKATWMPYWENETCVRSNHSNVKVSVYNRPGKGMVAVIANMGQEKQLAKVTFDLMTLQQTSALAAYDVLTDKEIPFAAGRLEAALDSLQFVMVWLKAR